MKKFVRKHRVGVAASTLVAVSLTVALVVSVHSLQGARAEARRGDSIRTFFLEVFDKTNAVEGDREITLRETFDYALGRVDEDLGSEPDAAAGVLYVIGKSLASAGSDETALTALERAQEYYQLAPDAPARERVGNLIQIARLVRRDGRPDQAIELYDRVLVMARELLKGRERAEVMAQVAQNLGAAYGTRGRLDDSRAYYQQAVEARRGLYPGGDEKLAYSLSCLAQATQKVGELEAAGMLFEETIPMAEKFSSDVHLAEILGRYSDYLAARGLADEEERALARVVELRERSMDPGTREIFTALMNHGVVLKQRGRIEEAGVCFDKALMHARRPDSNVSRSGLAKALLSRADTYLRPLPEGSIRPDAAVILIEEAVAILESSPRESDAQFLRQWRILYGRCLLELRRYQESERELNLARQYYLSTDNRSRVTDVDRFLLRLFEESDQPEKAKEVQSRSKE